MGMGAGPCGWGARRFPDVGVSGVEMVDAQLDRAAQQALGSVRVGGVVPMAWTGQLHGAVAEPDAAKRLLRRAVAADEVLAGGVRWMCCAAHQVVLPAVAGAARQRSGIAAATRTATRLGERWVVSIKSTDTPRRSRWAAASR